MKLRLGLACAALALTACGPRMKEDGLNGALIGAARAGQISRIRRLIRAGADPDAHGGVNGWPVLMHAIHRNQLAAARALLDDGANPDGRASHGDTALIMAAGYGNTAAVRLLLDRGADPRIENDRGDSALTMAVSGVADIDRFTLGSCQTETVKALLDASPGLKVGNSLWGHFAARLARFSGCQDTLNALEVRRARSEAR